MAQCKCSPSSFSPASALADLRNLLTNRAEREQSGRFFADGLRPVLRALATPGTRVELAVVVPSF